MTSAKLRGVNRILVPVWWLLLCSLLTRSIQAEISPAKEMLPGIFIHEETRTNPPTHFFVAVADLKNPRLHLRVSRGGPDPDGDGKWQTTLMEPTKIAEREHFDFVVNGDFFKAKGVNDGEGTNSAYRAQQWALAEGPAMTDGVAWATAANPRPCLVVHSNGAVTFENLSQPTADDREVIGGNTMLVEGGKIIPHKTKARHPRTAVGLDAAHSKLTFLLVDGRKPGVAVGMSYDELAAELLRLGCTEALNLDGGGSSVMAVRADGKMKILNKPTDGRERAVVNALGISVDKN
jgi:exopolysaccharide biosynthesis protein